MAHEILLKTNKIKLFKSQCDGRWTGVMGDLFFVPVKSCTILYKNTCFGADIVIAIWFTMSGNQQDMRECAVFSHLYHSKLNIFRFWSVSLTNKESWGLNLRLSVVFFNISKAKIKIKIIMYWSIQNRS